MAAMPVSDIAHDQSVVPLEGIHACVFDAYGTLFDVASAAHACSDQLGGQAAALGVLWRDKQLQYAWLRSVAQRHVDFWQVTGDALDFALASLSISTPGLRDRLLSLYSALRPFAEVPQVLRDLRQAGLRTAILSNGSPAMLDAAIASAGLAGMFDAVLSVEAVGVYKPHPAVYQLAVDRLGMPAGEIAFCSSNGWDAWAASAFGMQVVWCNRGNACDERLPGAPDRRVHTLAQLPALLGAG
ncbi:MAG: haloacid dehalogenase type II [Casimicrobiaceae bacterium]